MTSAWLPWLELLGCAAVIGVAGSRLSRYGEIIADKTGMGGTWVGVVLLATVTSLPELVTGISAVTVAAVPNIAVGDALGSCVFNLALLFVLDFLHRGESVYTRASHGHILSAGFGVMMIGLVGLSLLLSGRGRPWALAHVGVYTPAIALMYFIAMRTVFRYERRQMVEFAGEAADRFPEISLRQALRRYALAGLAVAAAGTWLPFVGAALAQQMGWHNSFVGTLFVAAATSLPEFVVTVSALRLGALDMAFANLLGSNLFNIFIVAVDDLFFLRGPILAHVSGLHIASAISAMAMSGIVIVGLLYRPPGRVLRSVGWISLLLLAGYLLNAYVLFLHGE